MLLNDRRGLVAIPVLMTSVAILTLLIIEAGDELASVQRDLLLARLALSCYVSIGETAFIAFSELPNAHALDIHGADEVSLQAIPALAVAVIQAWDAITSLYGTHRAETR